MLNQLHSLARLRLTRYVQPAPYLIGWVRIIVTRPHSHILAFELAMTDSTTSPVKLQVALL